MTTTTSATRICSDEGHLVARCEPCDLTLHHVEGFDVDVALGTFLHVHPSSEDAVHLPDLPAGWRAVVAPALRPDAAPTGRTDAEPEEPRPGARSTSTTG